MFHLIIFNIQHNLYFPAHTHKIYRDVKTHTHTHTHTHTPMALAGGLHDPYFTGSHHTERALAPPPSPYHIFYRSSYLSFHERKREFPTKKSANKSPEDEEISVIK